MYDINVIKQTVSFIKSSLQDDYTGHDWWHVHRVWNLSKIITEKEKGANAYIVELAALLHDVSDWKLNGGDIYAGPEVAVQWLKKNGVTDSICDEVYEIILNISFRGAKTKAPDLSLEGKIVQDADRLDAIGAIGIARVFAFGGYFHLPMHDPSVKSKVHRNFDEYKTEKASAINHFNEKLLLLKDRMNTKTGGDIAQEKHAFMEKYLEQFNNEWNLSTTK